MHANYSCFRPVAAVAMCALAVNSPQLRADTAYGIYADVQSTSFWGWNGSSSWTNSAGETVVNPHTEDWSVVLRNNTKNFSIARLSESFSYSFSSVSGGEFQQISFYNTKEGDEITFPRQTLTIADATGFKGWIGNLDKHGYGELVLPSASGATNSVNGVKLQSRLAVSVPGADMTARLGAVSGDGALYSTGSGRLIIDMSPGDRGVLYATNGTVEIVGRDSVEAFTPAIVPGAALHLDASAADTMTLERKDDGYMHVVEWRDASAGAVVCSADDYKGTASTHVPWCNTPYVSDDAVSPSGLPMVDFGFVVGSQGPTNCLLKMSEKISGVREIFVVGLNKGGGRGMSSYIGYSESTHYEWSGGDDAGLFDSSASRNVRNGDIRINGQKAPWMHVWSTRDGSSLSEVFVASAAADGSDGEGVVNLVGSDRYARFRTGNLRLGELLVYTNRLTTSQRAMVNDYLMRKWLKGHGDGTDFAAAYLGCEDSAAAISVPEGRVAKIGEITVADGHKLVKKGGGTLIVSTLSPAGCEIEVEGGSVKIAESPAVTADAPASDAYVWLDASDAASVVTGKVVSSNSQMNPDKYYVTRWNDCRGEGYDVYAEVPTSDVWDDFSSFITNYPTYVSAACNGMNTVWFGNNNASASWMWLQPHGERHAYEGFIVVRLNVWNVGRSPQYFGSSLGDMKRNPLNRETTRLLGMTCSPSATDALWYFDGMPLDPWAMTSLLADKSSYHVISFASAEPLCADMLARYYPFSQTKGRDGDISVGEFILYDRRLTAGERRETTAYLMKKWLDKELPKTSVSSTSFDSGTDTVIDADVDIVIDTVAGGTGSFVKRGDGCLGLAQPTNLFAYSSISVEAGTLEADLESPNAAFIREVMADALFDLDASYENGFSNEVAVVDGVVRTNVLSWADTLGREDAIAYSSQIATNTALCLAIGDTPSSRPVPGVEHPTLQYVEMPDGVMRPTVDFGEFGNSDKNAGAGMCFRYQFINVREVHTVFADTDPSRRGFICSARKEGGGKGYAFHRDQTEKGYLFADLAHDDVKNGYIAVDMETFPATGKALDFGFHLVSFAPLSEQWISTIAHDRTQRCGGCRISEQIAFNRELGATERERLQKHLMRKWLGTARDIAASYDSISVAAGATVSLGDDTAVSSSVLSGGGSVDVAEVRGVSRLEISGSVDTLTAAGKVVFADDAVTVVLVDSPCCLDPGEYVLFEAGEIANADLTVTLEGTFRPKRSVSVRRSGNRIVMTVNKFGLSVTFR